MRYNIYGNNSANFLGILSMGYSESPDITKFGPGYREQYFIHYVIDGEGYYNGNIVRSNQGFLIYPGQKEFYYPSKNNPWKFLWIIAEGTLMKEIFVKYNADLSTNIFKYSDVDLIKEIAEYIVNNNNKIIESLKITEMFLRMANSHISEEEFQKRKSNAEIYTDFCVKYIKENIHTKITVNELTKIIGVSQSYLYSIFSDRFNMSIKQYITQKKLRYAKKLLSSTELTIKEVANGVGYDDVFAFSKAFKQYYNISPSKLKKRWENIKIVQNAIRQRKSYCI